MAGWMDEETNECIIELFTCLAVRVFVNFHINIWNTLKDEKLKVSLKSDSHLPKNFFLFASIKDL